MHILHVTTFLQGGAGRMIAALAVAQKRAGHDVTVVADAGGDAEYQTYPEYIAQLHAANVPYATVDSTFARDRSRNRCAAKNLSALVRGRSPDVIHTHAAVPSIVARLACPSAPVVQTMHGWGVRKNLEQTRHDIDVMTHVEAVVTPSESAREMLQALGLARPVSVIPYGIAAMPASDIEPADRGVFDALRARHATIALCIGTIGPRKNQQLLVDALGTCDAVFIGEGDTTELLARARAIGVEHRVHVLGYRRDASRYLKYADVLVLPSRNEGLPITVIEAFRCGTPVVASDLPEFREMITDGETGFLFESERAESLRQTLARVDVASVEQRAAMTRAAESVYARRYTHDRMAEGYAQLYAQLAAAPVRRRRR